MLVCVTLVGPRVMHVEVVCRSLLLTSSLQRTESAGANAPVVVEVLRFERISIDKELTRERDQLFVVVLVKEPRVELVQIVDDLTFETDFGEAWNVLQDGDAFDNVAIAITRLRIAIR